MRFPEADEDRLPLDASGRLASDWPCVRCAYNLRGQAAAGACSECGTAVEASLRGYRLRYADAGWVAGLALAFRTLEIGAVTVLVTSMLMSGSPLLPRWSIFEAWQLEVFFVAAVVITLLVIGFCAYFGSKAIWGMTRAPPDGMIDEHTDGVRRFARIAAVIGWIPAPISLLAFLARAYGLVLFGAGWALIALAGLCTLMQYWRYLALRLPNRPLAGMTRFAMMGLTASVGCKLLVPLFMSAVWPTNSALVPNSPNVSMSLLPLSYLIDVLLITFALWTLFLLDLYRRHLREAAQQADKFARRNIPPAG